MTATPQEKNGIKNINRQFREEEIANKMKICSSSLMIKETSRMIKVPCSML